MATKIFCKFHFSLILFKIKFLLFVLIWRNNDNVSYHVSVTEFLLVWRMIWFNRLYIFVMFLFHRRKCLILKEHIVHKLMPLHSSIWVCVNSHKQLSELFSCHSFPNNFFESICKFIQVKRTLTVSISFFICFS